MIEFHIGQQLYFVPAYYSRQGARFLTVKKIGRQYLTLTGNIQIDKATLRIKDGTSRVYVSKEEAKAAIAAAEGGAE